MTEKAAGPAPGPAAPWGDGERQDLGALMPLVYRQLRRIAHRRLRGERAGHTLQTTALVHEAYLRFAGQEAGPWQSPGQFYAVAARMMRRILIDYARRSGSIKRGGERVRVELSAVDEGGGAETASEVLELHAALEELTRLDPRKGSIVELRFFGGLSIEETAEVLAVSPGTVMRDWTLAKAWLKRRLA